VWIIAASVLALSQPSEATTVTMPNAPFNWGTAFGVQGGTVKGLVGNIVRYNVPVFDIDPDPAEPSPEKIGNLDFQFMLWFGSLNAGANGPTDVYGASIFGGFNLTDLNDAGTRFAFQQVFTDNTFPNGKVDGGNFRGKFNGDVAGFGTWNYGGTQYDYFDNPFDSIGRLPNNGDSETVSFETALGCYTDDRTVSLLSDFTWGFTLTNNAGAYTLTGTSPVQQAFGSARLFNLYSNPNDPPGPTPAGSNPSLMQNIGVGSCHANALTPGGSGGTIPTDVVAEPPAWSMLVLGFALLAIGNRLKRVTADLRS